MSDHRARSAETAARTRKAVRIRDFIIEHAGHFADADTLRQCQDRHWLVIAGLAGERMPSPETRAAVVALFEAAEALADADPFAGIPA